MKKIRQSKGKSMRSTYFVFCEGKSEEAYVRYLRSCYRLPNKACHPCDPLKDRDFLMYNLDREDILPRLKKIKKAKIIASNPCFELWYLLHCINQKAEIRAAQCNEKLLRHISSYQKGYFCEKIREKLVSKAFEARRRASHLMKWENPSTDIYMFIDLL